MSRCARESLAGWRQLRRGRLGRLLPYGRGSCGWSPGGYGLFSRNPSIRSGPWTEHSKD